MVFNIGQGSVRDRGRVVYSAGARVDGERG